MADKEFPKGLMAKAPHEKAPDYVRAKLSIKNAELIAWLQARDGEWTNLQVNVSRDGKYYIEVDNWKPDGKGQDVPRTQRRHVEPDHESDPPTPDDDFPPF